MSKFRLTINFFKFSKSHILSGKNSSLFILKFNSFNLVNFLKVSSGMVFSNLLFLKLIISRFIHLSKFGKSVKLLLLNLIFFNVTNLFMEFKKLDIFVTACGLR